MQQLCSGVVWPSLLQWFDSTKVINVRTGCLDSHPFKSDWVRRLHLFYEELLTSSCFPSTFSPVKSPKQIFFEHSTTLTMLSLKEKKNRTTYEQAPMGKK